MKPKSRLVRSKPSKSGIVRLIGAILICEGVGILGGVVTSSSISTWYASLSKPVIVPPGWVFGPVWTVLYFLMGMSLYRAILKRAKLKWFVIQLILNFLWSYLFFGLHEVGLALLEIVVLFCAILATIIQFGKKDKLAARLLIPYAAWVAFATLLNLLIFLEN
jgi:translocator protein